MVIPRIQPTAPSLPFPAEICQEIANHLDRHDLSQLALACRDFQPIAEAHLYSRLDLSALTTANQSVQLYGRPVKDAWEVVHLLHSKATKAHYVRYLRLSLLPSSGRPRAEIVLQAVANNLENLDLQIAPGVWPPFVFNSFISALEQNLHGFPRLRRIALPLSILRSPAMGIIFKLTTRLEALTLYQMPSSSVLPRVAVPARRTPSTLTSITVTGLNPDNSAFLINLIGEATSTLNRLAIPPTQGQHIAPGAVCWPPLIEEIRSLESLASLEAPQGLPWQWHIGGFVWLRDLTLWREYDRCYVPSYETLTIPPLPRLQVLRFRNYRRMGSHSCFCCQHTHYPIPDKIAAVPIPPELLMAARQAPQLRAIEFHTTLPRPNAIYFPESDQDLPTKEVVESLEIHIRRLQDGPNIIEIRASTHVWLGEEGQMMHLGGRVEQEWVTINENAPNEEQGLSALAARDK